MKNLPLISVIIASYNAVSTIEKTINSVTAQTYPNIEFIVIDGGSTDGTVGILENGKWKKENGKRKNKIIFRWISEKDRGIADAFNKGMRMSHGDYIYFLGADDVLKTPHVIEEMMVGIDPKKDMIICGKVDRIRDTKKYSVIYTSSLQFSPWMLLYKMGLPHQGMFMNKRFFNKYGVFNTRLKYAMDYDLLLRAYHRFPNVIFKNVIVAGWREGGVGKNRIFEILKEYHSIRIRNHIAPFWFLWIIYVFSCIRYVPEFLLERFVSRSL